MSRCNIQHGTDQKSSLPQARKLADCTSLKHLNIFECVNISIFTESYVVEDPRFRVQYLSLENMSS